jgi:hypothetical protein
MGNSVVLKVEGTDLPPQIEPKGIYETLEGRITKGPYVGYFAGSCSTDNPVKTQSLRNVELLPSDIKFICELASSNCENEFYLDADSSVLGVICYPIQNTIIKKLFLDTPCEELFGADKEKCGKFKEGIRLLTEGEKDNSSNWDILFILTGFWFITHPGSDLWDAMRKWFKGKRGTDNKDVQKNGGGEAPGKAMESSRVPVMIDPVVILEPIPGPYMRPAYVPYDPPITCDWKCELGAVGLLTAAVLAVGEGVPFLLSRGGALVAGAAEEVGMAAVGAAETAYAGVAGVWTWYLAKAWGL